MKHSILNARNCIKTTIAAVVFGISQLSSAAPQDNSTKHSFCEQVKHNHAELDARDARKVVRRFLSSRGYTKSIAPGGAHIRNIEQQGEQWKVLVALRDSSAADVKKHWLYIDKLDHSISDVAKVSNTRVASK